MKKQQIIDMADLEYDGHASSRTMNHGASNPPIMRLKADKEKLYIAKGLSFDAQSSVGKINRPIEISEYIGSKIAHLLLGEDAPNAQIGKDADGKFFILSEYITGYYNQADQGCSNVIGHDYRDVVIDLLNYLDQNGPNIGTRVDQEGIRHAALIDLDSSLYGLDNKMRFASGESNADFIANVELVLSKKPLVLQEVKESMEFFRSLFEEHSSQCDVNDFRTMPNAHFIYLGEHLFNNNIQDKLKWWDSTSVQRAEIYLQNCTLCDGDFALGLSESIMRITDGLKYRFDLLAKGLVLLKTNAALVAGDINLATGLFSQLTPNDLEKLWPAEVISLFHQAIIQHAVDITRSMDGFFNTNIKIAKMGLYSCMPSDYSMSLDDYMQFCQEAWSKEGYSKAQIDSKVNAFLDSDAKHAGEQLCKDIESYKPELLPTLEEDAVMHFWQI